MNHALMGADELLELDLEFSSDLEYMDEAAAEFYHLLHEVITRTEQLGEKLQDTEAIGYMKEFVCQVCLSAC